MDSQTAAFQQDLSSWHSADERGREEEFSEPITRGFALVVPAKGKHWKDYLLLAFCLFVCFVCLFFESLEPHAMLQIVNKKCRSHRSPTLTEMGSIHCQYFTCDKVKAEYPSSGGEQPAFKPHLPAWWREYSLRATYLILPSLGFLTSRKGRS